MNLNKFQPSSIYYFADDLLEWANCSLPVAIAAHEPLAAEAVAVVLAPAHLPWSLGAKHDVARVCHPTKQAGIWVVGPARPVGTVQAVDVGVGPGLTLYLRG